MSRLGPNQLAGLHPVAWGCVALTLLYFYFMLSMAALPGQNAEHPLGWWGWFDQGRTLDSARAFNALDLSAARHWYPPGYALMGAPFTVKFRAHPFAIVDLACLLVTLGAFVQVARACGLGRLAATALFVASVTWDPQMFGEWVIPWNSTPAAALLWTILALVARWLRGDRHPLLLGLLVGAMPLIRPTEAAVAGACVLWLLAADWRRGPRAARAGEGAGAGGGLRLAHLLWLGAGAGAMLAVALGLHLAIYGWRLSEYMLVSRRLGFTLHDFGWKAYILLADPYWWWTEGPGLLRRIPWAVLGLAGLLPALVRGGVRGALAAALAVHMVLYICYMDLLPTGLWRFNNIHYFKWAVPGYALLGWLLVTDLVRWRWSMPSLAAAAGLALAAGLSLVRVAPRPALPDEPAKMLEYRGPSPGFDQSYFAEMTLQDDRGPLLNVQHIRAIPVPGGMRVIALARRVQGPVAFQPGHGLPAGLLDAPPERFVPQLVLGRPCWMPGSFCGKRPVNPLLPPYTAR